MTDTSAYHSLLTTVDAYFETMFDADLVRFDRLFAPSAAPHGLSDGALRVLPAAHYRRLLRANPSPKSKSAPRQQEVLLIDFASAEQALVKARVRIDQILCVDYLVFHWVTGAWRLTAKSFYIEHRFASLLEDRSR